MWRDLGWCMRQPVSRVWDHFDVEPPHDLSLSLIEAIGIPALKMPAVDRPGLVELDQRSPLGSLCCFSLSVSRSRGGSRTRTDVKRGGGLRRLAYVMRPC
jgi:hypothetical protein